MRRKEIERLQQIQGFPALTITLPTYRTAPEVQQNSIRLKNLITQAQTLLDEQHSNGEGHALITRLTEVVDGLETNDFQEGLAIFVHEDFAGAFPTAMPLPERVVLDNTFVTRDLVRARLHGVRYRVVALSEHTRLFEGSNDRLKERTDAGFPVIYEDRSEDPAIPGALEPGHENLVDEEHRQFYRRVDNALTQVQQEEELPVVLLGVTRNLAFFKEVTANEKMMAGTAEGNYDHASWDDIAVVAWQALQPYLAQQQDLILQQWDDAVSAKLFVTGVEQAWEAAFDGRGNLLLVEEGYQAAGQVDDSGRTLTLTQESPPHGDGNGTRYDVVDDLIELVWSRGGRVRFIPPETLPDDAHVGLTLRY